MLKRVSKNDLSKKDLALIASILVTYIFSFVYYPYQLNKSFFTRTNYSIAQLENYFTLSIILIGVILLYTEKYKHLTSVFITYSLLFHLAKLPIVLYRILDSNYIGFGATNYILFIILGIIFLIQITKQNKTELKVTLDSFTISVISALFILLYWVGKWLPWYEKVYKMTKEGNYWKVNGESTYVEKYNRFFIGGNFQGHLSEMLTILISVLTIIFIAIFRDKISRAICISLFALLSLVVPLQSTLNPLGQVTTGYTKSEIENFGIVVTHTKGIGVWVSLFAIIALFFISLFTFLYNKINFKR